MCVSGEFCSFNSGGQEAPPRIIWVDVKKAKDPLQRF